MSYQVLARKYRPHTFAAMVGQEHALRALINALDQNRLHHAYLFTGTRGVGKTTLARLLAKCFNCEKSVSSNPCNECTSCIAIDEGRFVDLIEVDAASRTKVEDTRELLENVQYKPAHGRYKVYLIDEVHMLSGHSFNALLKTLEEPPPHVKFLLATTDPQRLPITILSRCLQFRLKNLSPEQIKNQLQYVLTQENITCENNALTALAKAAQGSMRDALSLLDQAIAFGNHSVLEKDVNTMLGTIEQTHIFTLLNALVQHDGKTILNTIQHLQEQGADFNLVLEDLLSTLHRIAIIQTIPDAPIEEEHKTALCNFAKNISREDIQLYYQIALIGRRDLPLAPSARTGFEMLLLRMLAFTLIESETTTSAPQNVKPATTAIPNNNPAPTKIAAPPTPTATSAASQMSLQNIDWPQLVAQLNLSGFAHALAMNCTLQQVVDHTLHLALDPIQAALQNPKQEARLKEALSSYFGKTILLQITTGQTNLATPNRILKNQQTARQNAATETINNDPNVQALLSTFNATLQTDTIAPKEALTLSSEAEIS